MAVTCPTVNCYKRLKLGSGLQGSRSGFTWPPGPFISYGDNNRTQMIRTAGPGHVEDRTVSAGCNPYLGLAAYLAAGLDGVENQIDPGEPNLGNLYEKTLDEISEAGISILPQSLGESLAALKNDAVVQGGLGVIADEFIDVKTRELETSEQQVTSWEIDRYLTLF
ncbi:MAG: hypothetical protein Ct9H300mP1_04240 [Planctomycetaceae bacterium]|nr:MAG: hypothetical protein Ct9H300mP1_04240 [Planctomycetaceae bacterium]